MSFKYDNELDNIWGGIHPSSIDETQINGTIRIHQQYGVGNSCAAIR